MSDNILLTVLNMSFTAGIVILIVMLVRLPLRKVPKIYSYGLWSVVLFRLLCPVSPESALSLLPAKPAPISPAILYVQNPQVDTGIAGLDRAINVSLPAATPYASVNPLQLWVSVGEMIWLAGIAVMLLCSMVSLIKLRKRLQGSTHYKDNIYLVEALETPFLLGLLRPQIYLPANFSDSKKEYILLHEQTHIRRLDHIVKLISYFALCIHWFNPLVWAAFFLSGRDMEMSCDETVLKTLGSSIKKEYSSSLLDLSTGRRMIAGTPLAFGEGDTKGRIKNVLSYQKPTFWIAAVSLTAILTVGLGLSLNPISSYSKTGTGSNASFIDPSSSLEESISSAILADAAGPYLRGEAAGEGHITLETRVEGKLTYAYIIEQYMEFGFENGALTGVFGHLNPSVLIFSRNSDGTYSLESYERPADGSDFTSTLERMFTPSALEKYHVAEGKDNDKTRTELNRQLEAYGTSYLKLIGRTAKVDLKPTEKAIANMNAAASNYLGDAYGEYPYWLGTREQVEDGVRYLYERRWVDQGGGNGIVTLTKRIFQPSGGKGEAVELTVIEIKDDEMTALEGALRKEHDSKYR